MEGTTPGLQTGDAPGGRGEEKEKEDIDRHWHSVRRMKEVSDQRLKELDESLALHQRWLNEKELSAENHPVLSYIYRTAAFYIIVLMGLVTLFEVGEGSLFTKVSDSERDRYEYYAGYVVVGFGSALLIDLFSWYWRCPTRTKSRLNALLCAINATAFATYLAISYNLCPTLVGYGERPFQPLRYVQWSVTTPTFLLLIAEIDHRSFGSKALFAAMCFDEGMILTGLLSGLSHSFWWWLFWLTLSSIFFMPVLYFMWQTFTNAIETSVLGTDISTLRVLRAYTVCVWCMFPIIYISSSLGIISVELEGFLSCLMDVAAKVIYSLALLNVNFWTINQFQMIIEAQREEVLTNAVETAARIEEFNKLLGAAKMDAEVKAKVQRTFIGQMSHELRTPLNSVIAFNSLLLESELNLEQRRYVSSAITSAETLLAMINNILEFMKYEENGVLLEDIPFDLAKLLEDLVDVVSWKANGKQIEYITHPAMGCPLLLRGDPLRLYQILLNLVDNAIKFSPPGGTVTLRVSLLKRRRATAEKDKEKEEKETEKPKEERFTELAENENMAIEEGKEKEKEKEDVQKMGQQEEEDVLIRFTVEDTGIGIKKSDFTLLFHPFSQVSSSSTRNYDGVGLGLVICKKIVDAMMGTIEVVSEGYCFSCKAENEEEGELYKEKLKEKIRNRWEGKIKGKDKEGNKNKNNNSLAIRQANRAHFRNEATGQFWGSLTKVDGEIRKGTTFNIDIPFKALACWETETPYVSTLFAGKKVLALVNHKGVENYLMDELSRWGATVESGFVGLMAGGVNFDFDIVVKDCGFCNEVYERMKEFVKKNKNKKKEGKKQDEGKEGNRNKKKSRKDKQKRIAVLVMGCTAKDVAKFPEEKDALDEDFCNWAFFRKPIKSSLLVSTMAELLSIPMKPLAELQERRKLSSGKILFANPIEGSLTHRYSLLEDEEEFEDAKKKKTVRHRSCENLPRTPKTRARKEKKKKEKETRTTKEEKKDKEGKVEKEETKPGKEEQTDDASSSSNESESEGEGPLKVLVVEDNLVNQKVFIAILKRVEKTGIPISYDTAVNGKEAVDMVGCKSYDIIMMDVQMPVMDGLQATKEIRKMEDEGVLTHTNTIVAMTASASDEDRANCLSAGMNVFLSKPVYLKDVEKLLRMSYDKKCLTIHTQRRIRKDRTKKEIFDAKIRSLPVIHVTDTTNPHPTTTITHTEETEDSSSSSASSSSSYSSSSDNEDDFPSDFDPTRRRKSAT